MRPRITTQLSAFLLLAMASAAGAQGRVFLVNTTNDTPDASPGNGMCADAGGACSLRAAISEANFGASTNPDRVDVPGGIYVISLGPLQVTASMTIRGTGAGRAVIQGATAGNGLFALGSVLYARKLFQGTDSVTGMTVPRAVVNRTDDFENCLQEEGCLGKAGLVNLGGVSAPTPIHPVAFDFALTPAEQAAVTGTDGLGVIRVEASRDIGRKLGATNADVVSVSVEGNAAGEIFHDTIDTCVRFHNEDPIDFDCGPNFNNDFIGGASQTLPSAFMQTAAADGSIRVLLAPISYGLSDVGRIKFFSAELLYLKNIEVNLRSLTIQGGTNSAIFNSGALVKGFDLVVKDNSAPVGAGIWNQYGSVRLADSTVADNTAFAAGGIYNAVLASVYLDRSTVSGNRANDRSGGGVFNLGILELLNSTVSGNLARLGGGGVLNQGAFSAIFATISDNSANLDLSQNFNAEAVGGGIANLWAGRVTLANSILAGNRDGRDSGLPAPAELVSPDCFDVAVATGPPLRNFLSARDNLIGALSTNCDLRDGDALVTGLPAVQSGTPATPLDTGLGPLADNGGFSRTHALETGSPAIDADSEATPSYLCPGADQRGFRRPGDSAGDTVCDIGAYEAGGQTAVLVDPATGTSPVTVTFPNLNQPGTTRLEILSSGPATPAGFQLGSPPLYYEISTTAAFTPPVVVCIDYSGTSFPNSAALRLLHYEDTDSDGMPDSWVDHTVSNDTVKKIICASVNSFSLFAPFERLNRQPHADAGPDQRIECNPGTPVTLDGSASSDPDGDSLQFEWRNAAGQVVGSGSTLSVTPPPGSSRFTLTVTDPGGLASSDSVLVDVVDTTRPVIQQITASPNVLWPPNNALVPVEVKVSVADRCDAGASCRIVDVGSNEPGTDRGPNPDWRSVGPLTVKLRAQRSGQGGGRVYTIVVECQDAAGNATRGTVTVTVPHDQRR